jgi:hypothetical protein
VTDVVIKAENLGKKYTIGHQAERGRYVALRDVLVQNARNFWRTTTDLLRGKPIIQGNELEEVWALKVVSSEIRCGQFEPNYGIIEMMIGPNHVNSCALSRNSCAGMSDSVPARLG